MFIVKWWEKIINIHTVFIFVVIHIIVQCSLSSVPLSSNIVSYYKIITNQKHQKWIKWSPCLFILIFIYSSCSNCLIVPTDNHPDTCKTVTIVLQHLHKNTKFNNHDLKLVLYKYLWKEMCYLISRRCCVHTPFFPQTARFYFLGQFTFSWGQKLFFLNIRTNKRLMLMLLT